MQLKKNQNYIEDIKELIDNTKQHFYIVFPITNTVCSQLNWVQYHSLQNIGKQFKIQQTVSITLLSIQIKQHFYIVFPIVNTVRSQLNWIQYHSLPNLVWERGVNILNREI